MIEFTEKDINQLRVKGISRAKVEGQIRTFIEGIPFMKLEAPAVINNGILKLSPTEEEKFLKKFESEKDQNTLLKFVPASGAASRMFKALFEFLENYKPEKETLNDFIRRAKAKDIEYFFENAPLFPFYANVLERINKKGLSTDLEKVDFVKELLGETGLNYGFYPKGLLPFHNYKENAVTPFEEHLYEGAQYASSKGKSQLHFTISEQHRSLFEAELKAVETKVSKLTKTDFKVSFSYQKGSTDTIAVDMENQPFRNNDSSLLFRPGGHGALIENLNEQDADIIFIKNIDNVVTQERSAANANSKKILAGVLLDIQKEVFQFSKLIDANTLDGEQLAALKSFLEQDLNVRFSERFNGFTIGQQIEILKDKLHRPLRVCGMVVNEGEPGGGPYWVRAGNGNISLQIVESAQVDKSNPEQLSIFKKATHFNPVDIVCGVKDYKGEKYDLLKYVDEKQGFITHKTKEGKDLKALELPGLWNGAMAYWNTIFVEVPSATFNPVKTVNDLLKPAHRVKG